MNTIEFSLTTFDQETERDYLVVQTKLDGELLVDFNVFATDLRAIEQSITRSGPAFIITCWCGIAECVGLRWGINIYHEGSTIRWRIPAPLPERTFIFDRIQYTTAYQTCITKGRQRITNRRHTTTKLFSVTPEQNTSYFALQSAKNTA